VQESAELFSDLGKDLLSERGLDSTLGLVTRRSVEIVADAEYAAVGRGRNVRTGNPITDPRWPDFGKRAADETGIVSMLSVRLFLEDDDLVAALNMSPRCKRSTCCGWQASTAIENLSTLPPT
jgi:hypothetical protein